MSSQPAETLVPRASDPLPEQHGRINTLPDPRLPSWSASRRARIAAIAFWGNLVCQMGIILSGGAVRLTGSGLGCSTWPNCEPGQFTPELTLEAGIHPFVEFGNRTLTGVLGIFAIAVLLVSWRWLRHKGVGFRRLAWVPLIGTALQAIIGAFVVWLDLHPGLVSPHFLISPVIVAASTVLVVRLYEGDGSARRVVGWATVGLYAGLAAVGFTVLVLGTLVTGTGPHSGDDGDITRIAIDPLLISRIHAGSVWLFCGLLVVLLVLLHRSARGRQARIAAWTLVALTVLQGVIGYVQFFTGLPELLVFFHLLGAALFAAGIAWVGARLITWRTAESEAQTAPPADRARDRAPHHPQDAPMDGGAR